MDRPECHTGKRCPQDWFHGRVNPWDWKNDYVKELGDSLLTK